MKLLVGINKITIDEKSKLNAGEYNIHEVEFEFDEVYNGLITKAVFEGNGHSYLIDIVNNKCIIPYEVLSEKGDITIGAYGYNIDGNDLVLRYSPSPIYTYVDLGSYRDSYDNYQQPTADIIEQLTNRIETAESQINEALEEVEEYNDRITTNTNNIDNLDNNKVDKIEGKGLSSNDYTNEEKTKLEGIEANAEVNIIEDIKVNNTSQSINNKSVNISIPTKTSDITNDSGFIDNSVNNLMNYTKSSDLATVATSGSYNDLSNKPTIPDVSSFITKDVNNLTNYTLKTDTGSLIDLEINNTTYVVTLSLKDIDGNVISTDTVDLPLENVVVSGRYDNNTKKVILTLENGSEVDFSVADLVADLQTEITSTNKLASDLVDDSNSGNKFTNTSEKATWNAKYDKPISGIPKSDLTNDVQSSLNLADSALQSFTETDPIFSNSASAGITSNDISKWNNKQDTLIAGTNITIDNDGKTISATDTTYNDATTSASGLMSASDKTKLNGIETEANKTIVDNAFNSSSTNPLQNKVITDFIGTNATVTGTGTEFNLSNCLNKKLKNFKGYGDTEQDSLSGKNLLEYPFVNTTMTTNGITFTDNGDGTITANGTATANALFYLVDGTGAKGQKLRPLILNKSIILSGSPSGASNSTYGIQMWNYNNNNGFIYDYGAGSNAATFTNENSNFNMVIIVKSGVTVNNVLFKPMIRLSTESEEYEPYCGGTPAPNPDYPIPYYGVTGRQVVKFNSKNLFNKDNAQSGTFYNTSNGSIISSSAWSQSEYIPFNSNTIFTISSTYLENNSSFELTQFDENKQWITSRQFSLISGSWTETTENNTKYIKVGFRNDRNVELNIQLEQSPTPSPYTPYQQEEYEINLGKNLLPTSPEDWEQGSLDTNNGTNATNVDRLRTKDYIPVNIDTDYYISLKSTDYKLINIWTYDSNKQGIYNYYSSVDDQISGTQGLKIKFPSSISSNVKYIRVIIRRTDFTSVTADEITIAKPQLELGDTSTSYSPYFEPIKLYKDEYIYNKDNEWMIKRNFGESLIKQVILASKNASKETLYQVDFGNFSNMKIQNWGKGYCDYFIANTTKSDGTIRFGANDNKIYAYTNNSSFSSTANANTWLSSNNVKVLYQLAEPYEEKITNTELINQLNAIQPLLGDNIITIDTANELLMNVDIEAYTNTLSGKLEYLLDNV